MTTLLIGPITTKSVGGYPATITGIDPQNDDILIGEIATNAGKMKGRWNSSGIMRGGTSDCNLDIADDDINDAIDLANKISNPLKE